MKMSDFINAVELVVKPHLLNHLDKLKENIKAYGYLEYLESYIKLSLGNIANNEIDELVELISPMLPIEDYEDNILTKIHGLFTSEEEIKGFGNAIVIMLIHVSNKKRNLYNLN